MLQPLNNVLESKGQGNVDKTAVCIGDLGGDLVRRADGLWPHLFQRHLVSEVWPQAAGRGTDLADRVAAEWGGTIDAPDRAALEARAAQGSRLFRARRESVWG